MGLKQEDYIYYLHKTSTDDPAVIEDIFNNGLKSWNRTSNYELFR